MWIQTIWAFCPKIGLHSSKCSMQLQQQVAEHPTSWLLYHTACSLQQIPNYVLRIKMWCTMLRQQLSWLQKNKQKKTQAKQGGEKHNSRAALQSRLYSSCCPVNPTPSPPLDHRPLGLFSSFKMTHIFTLCPPPPPLPLPWPVPKGSSAHGGQVSCRPLKNHGADVQGPKTMLRSSKQTRTCSHSDRCGRITQAHS